uniref:Ribosomal protein L34e superfamily protein n=1 Tax=Solanum lycopersicum TaxID=4081 RepID=A0A3Q7FLE2_SOLLC
MPNHSGCQQSRYALIDVMILIAVIGACGVLLYPSVNLLVNKVVEFFRLISSELKEEIFEAPVAVCTGRRCGKPGCRGLKKAAEFDIQLETEDCVKNSNLIAAKDGVNKKGLFELPRDHHKELEAELKRMAPPNGRAVLIFRGRCGCSVGTMEVPGPKKTRKILDSPSLVSTSHAFVEDSILASLIVIYYVTLCVRYGEKCFSSMLKAAVFATVQSEKFYGT